MDDDGRPHWLLVDTSFFPGFSSVIPVTDVLVTDKGLEVHYDMEKLTGAPNAMKGRDFAAHREGRLYDYYGLQAPEGVEATHHGEAGRCCSRRARSAASPPFLREQAHGVQRRGLSAGAGGSSPGRPPKARRRTLLLNPHGRQNDSCSHLSTVLTGEARGPYARSA